MERKTQERNNNKPARRKFCIFCKEDMLPDYKDVLSLKRFTTDRGKIVARAKSGVCFKHQRKLSTAVKRSRYMALMPFSVSVR